MKTPGPNILACLALSLLIGAPAARSQSVSGTINAYYQVTAVNTSTSTITVSNAGGLSPGMRILLIQMQGATLNGSNNSSFGNIQSLGEAGQYELNSICGISGNDVLMQNSLLHNYDVNGQVQLVTLPVYNSVTIADTVRASPWDPVTGTGGVVALQAIDTIYLNSSITVSGMGFGGAAIQNFPTPTYDCNWSVNVSDYFLSSAPSPNLFYSGGRKGYGIAAYITNKEFARGRQANGGGGGNNHNTGGGGGGNYGSGGAGGNRSNEGMFYCHGTSPGEGGMSLSSVGYTPANNRIYMGGGGGSGHMNNLRGTPGGSGGGIILLMAGHIQASGHPLLANGARPYNALCNDHYQAEGDGGGGGGAGGTVLLKVTTVSGSLPVEIKGAAGSNSSHNASTAVNECDGPGGGGGGSGHMNNLRGTPGGAGGGIILLMAGHIQASGHPLLANGTRPYNALCNDHYQAEGDGGGGGGAGGTVLLKVTTVSGSLPVEIKGAAGSNSSHNASTAVNECDGPGGGGGGGVLWYSGSSLPASVTWSASGGANGVISTLCGVAACRGQANGASPGNTGTALANWTPQESSSSVCAPLALGDLRSFRVSKLAEAAQLDWEIRSMAAISSFIVERSTDQVYFERLATVSNPGNTRFQYMDRQPMSGTVYYRLRWTENDGRLNYSRIVPVQWPTTDRVFWYPVQPNPSSGPLSLSFYSPRPEPVRITWYSSQGAMLGQISANLIRGQNRITVPLTGTAAGLCWIQAEGTGWRQTQKVMRVR